MKKLTDHMLRKRYSPRTIACYTGLVRRFTEILGDIQPSSLSDEDIALYIKKYYVDSGYSRSYQNQAVNALKLYYKTEFDRQIEETITLRPRRERTLPIVLSQNEVRKILTSFKNTKHRTIFYLIYSAGLRIGEVVHLAVRDIDSERNVIRVRQSKGAKDREVPLSETALTQLRIYYRAYRPRHFLFEGQTGGQYSTRSIQVLFKRALRKNNIQKHATVHSLRHSYATHLLESSTDIRIIQELLGHKSTKTTEIYTHVSQRLKQRIPNPLDQLNIT